MDSGAVIKGIYKTDHNRTSDILQELFPEKVEINQHNILGFGRPENPSEGKSIS